MKFTPLHDRIIVEEIQENRRRASGLFIPDAHTFHKAVAFGKVIAVGTGRINVEGKTVPLIVSEGDTVCYPRQAAGPIPVYDADGNELVQLMLREADVLAIVTGMPVASSILDLSGAPLSLTPQSHGLPDIVYENRDGCDRAERLGVLEPGEMVDEPT